MSFLKVLFRFGSYIVAIQKPSIYVILYQIFQLWKIYFQSNQSQILDCSVNTQSYEG